MESDNINSFPVVNSVLKKLSAEFIVKFCMFVDHQNVTDTFEHPLYIRILQEYAIPAIANLCPHEDYFFQEDNAPCHTARTTKKFFEEKQIRRLPWPASSPDLNPIEHLWDEVERRIRVRRPAPSNLQQLNVYVQEAWKEIPPEIYCNLIESMPRRCKAVIEAQLNTKSMSFFKSFILKV